MYMLKNSNGEFLTEDRLGSCYFYWEREMNFRYVAVFNTIEEIQELVKRDPDFFRVTPKSECELRHPRLCVDGVENGKYNLMVVKLEFKEWCSVTVETNYEEVHEQMIQEMEIVFVS